MTSPSEDEVTAMRDARAVRLGTVDLCTFADQNVIPLLKGSVAKTPFQEALFGTYYRMQLWLRSFENLDDPMHFQAVLAGARGVYEMFIDMKLLQADHGLADKFHGFVIVTRFDAAKKYVDAWDADRGVGRADTPEVEVRRSYIDNAAVRSERDRLLAKHWGSSKARPPHWSGHDMATRTKDISPAEHRRYREIYPQLNWFVHSGSAGIAGVSRQALIAGFVWGHGVVQVLFAEATEVLFAVEPQFLADPTLLERFEAAKRATGRHLLAAGVDFDMGTGA
jgi:hypothetical protein